MNTSLAVIDGFRGKSVAIFQELGTANDFIHQVDCLPASHYRTYKQPKP